MVGIWIDQPGGVSIRFKVRGGFRLDYLFGRPLKAFQSALRFAVVSDEGFECPGIVTMFQSALRFAVVSDVSARHRNPHP